MTLQQRCLSASFGIMRRLEVHVRCARPARKPSSRLRIASNALNCSPGSTCDAGIFALPLASPVPHAPTSCALPASDQSSISSRGEGEDEATLRRFRACRSLSSSSASSSSYRSICASPSASWTPRSGVVASLEGPATGASDPKTAHDGADGVDG